MDGFMERAAEHVELEGHEELPIEGVKEAMEKWKDYLTTLADGVRANVNSTWPPNQRSRWARLE